MFVHCQCYVGVSLLSPLHETTATPPTGWRVCSGVAKRGNSGQGKSFAPFQLWIRCMVAIIFRSGFYSGIRGCLLIFFVMTQVEHLRLTILCDFTAKRFMANQGISFHRIMYPSLYFSLFMRKREERANLMVTRKKR